MRWGFDSPSRSVPITRLSVPRSSDYARLDALGATTSVRRVLEMLVLKPNGKPRLREPERIAGILSVPVKAVRRLIEDFQRKVGYLVTPARVSRAQAWALLKNPSPWAAVVRGIKRSKAGRNAGSRPRPGRKGY
jgi:hypothetical protein